MAQKDQPSRWANIATIFGTIIALGTLVLGGGFFYREVWYVSDLRYTVLPTYDVEEMAFSGLVVENRGRVPARNVYIILSNLEHDIQALHIPGPHEKADITWDPNKATNGAVVEMERLSPGSSLSIYLITSGPVTLAEGKTFTISSDRGKARPSPEAGGLVSTLGSLWIVVGLFVGLSMNIVASMTQSWLAERREKRRRREEAIKTVLEWAAMGRKASLRRVDLRGADLRGVDLGAGEGMEEGADLSYADLRWADLENANLQRARLVGANLQGATLGGADLEGALLESANLRDARLEGTDLRWADLRNANLQGASLVHAKLQRAWAGKNTVWPEGFEIPEGVVIE